MSRWDAWLFTCNPKRYDVFTRVRRSGPLHEFEWSMSANWSHIGVGDDFAFYIGGCGVHLFGTVTGDPVRHRTDDNLWLNSADRDTDKWFAPLRTTGSIWLHPITIDDLKRQPALNRITGQLSRPSKSPMGLTRAELNTIRSLCR